MQPNLRVHIRTSAPQWIFHDPSMATHYSDQAIDVGLVQADSLNMDLTATLAACRAVYANPQPLIDHELAFVRANKINLIAADTPPLAFEIAALAGVPSVSITNFTWDVIYRAYVSTLPEFTPLIATMTECYGKATDALTLPYPCDTAMFPRQQPIPWITRNSNLTKEQARNTFALPQTASIVLLSFGGLGLERLPWNQLAQQNDYLFVTTGSTRGQTGNLLTLPATQTRYQDLLRAADAIITKPGYGIVADVLAQRVPILYTDRGEFPEYPRLVAALRDNATAKFIPQDQLLAGNLLPYLRCLLRKTPNWPDIDLHGAQVAAEKILSTLDSPR